MLNWLNGPRAGLITVTVTHGSRVMITDLNAALPPGYYQIQISNP